MHPKKLICLVNFLIWFLKMLLRCESILTLFKMGLFGAVHEWKGWGRGKKAKYYTYPTMTKLGSYTLPKEDPKNI